MNSYRRIIQTVFLGSDSEFVSSTVFDFSSIPMALDLETQVLSNSEKMG